MVQTYQGYFTEDGRFVPDGTQVKMPTRRRTIVNIFLDESADNVTQQSDTALQDRIERIGQLLSAASSAENEMTDDDWDEMLTLRSKTNAGLSRTVDI